MVSVPIPFDSMPDSRGKILVIRGGAIGDFILTLPVLAALRQQFPNARLEVLGYPHIAQLALLGGLADQVQSIEARPLAGFFAQRSSLDGRLAEYFAGFALIISYLYDPDNVFQENVARCSKAQFIAGPHRPNENESVHATDVFLKPLERLAIFDADAAPRINLNAARNVAGAENSVSRWLACHPGSGSERKNWPEENWATLLQRLADKTGLQFLLLGGEAEGERLARLAALVPPNRIKVAQSLPLPEVAALIGECQFYVGHDSGITHLAAALGLPGLVLWGGTNESVWRPRGQQMSLLRNAHGLAAISVEEVEGQIRMGKAV